MPNFRRKQAISILLTIVFFISGLSFLKSTLVVMKSRNRLDNLSREVTELKKEKVLLTEELNYQKSDEFIEEEARNMLNMVKENEVIYVVTEDVLGESSEKTLTIRDANYDLEQKSNFKQWIELLF